MTHLVFTKGFFKGWCISKKNIHNGLKIMLNQELNPLNYASKTPKERRKECFLINVVVGPIIGWVTQSEPTSWGNKKIYCLQGRVSSSVPQLCCTGKVKLLLARLSITSHFSESVATLCFYMPVDKEEFQAQFFTTCKKEGEWLCLCQISDLICRLVHEKGKKQVFYTLVCGHDISS